MGLSRIAPAARHARQIVLPEVGLEGQRRIASARVLVVGCGGLGAPVVHYLAAAGVGHLTLVDDDVVEPSNLNRQVLFGTDDVGLRKAQCAAAAARAIDPALEVVARVERLAASSLPAALLPFDVIVDATDGMPTKFLLNDACVLGDRLLIHGAATGFAGQVLVVPGRRGPCLRCLFEAPPPRDAIPTCRDAGILGAVTGVVGSVMAAEVIKALVAPAHTLVGRFFAIDVLEPSTRALQFERRKDCAACGDEPSVDLQDSRSYESDHDENSCA